MLLIDRLAEERIQQSLVRGELDNLPGCGQRLQFDNDEHVPEALRAGYRLLNNAGFVPAEIQWRREIAKIESVLTEVIDKAQVKSARRRLLMLQLQLERGGRSVSPLWADPVYGNRLQCKLVE